MTLSRKLRLAALAFLVAGTVGCDQTSKLAARTALRQADSILLSGGLIELRLAENPGSFLSLGAVLPEAVRSAVFTVGVGIGLIALTGYLAWRSRIDVIRFIGLSLVLAGGLSNLLDRVFQHGLVTDFVTIHIGPLHTGIFNIADVLIMIGIGVITFGLWKSWPRDTPASRIERTS